MHLLLLPLIQGYHCGSDGKESSCNAGNLGSTPGLGRPPGEGQGYPLQYSGLENSMDCIGHGVAKSPIQLSDFHFPLIQEKESESVSRSVVSDSCNRMAVARQGPLSTGILQVRILEWVAFPPPGKLSNTGIEPGSPALQADSLPSETPGKPRSGEGWHGLCACFYKEYVFKTWVQFPARCYEVRWKTHGSIELAAAAAKVL